MDEATQAVQLHSSDEAVGAQRKAKPSRHPFVVGVASLRSGSVGHLDVTREGRIDGLEMRDSHVPDADSVVVSARLEPASDGIMVSATVNAAWAGICRRCLGAAGGELRCKARELYSTKPGIDEAYPMSGSQLDLESMVRDAILLELPQVPLCRQDCAGLCSVCGADRNSVECSCEPGFRDPRWTVLDELR